MYGNKCLIRNLFSLEFVEETLEGGSYESGPQIDLRFEAGSVLSEESLEDLVTHSGIPVFGPYLSISLNASVGVTVVALLILTSYGFFG